ncbi:MAG: acyl-CoA thioesterase [Burkholderiales bacterium]|jgi:acyl-CoA thioester hydrolase
MTAPPAPDAPLRVHAKRIAVGDADLPDDRFSDHVNNARYFAFINLTFREWYVAMGLRGGIPDRTAVMARVEYDFLREVKPPGEIECRIEVMRVGRTSLEHAVEIVDLGRDGRDAPRLAGRGRVVHVFMDRTNGASLPWPAELIALCRPREGAAAGPDASTPGR